MYIWNSDVRIPPDRIEIKPPEINVDILAKKLQLLPGNIRTTVPKCSGLDYSLQYNDTIILISDCVGRRINMQPCESISTI